MGDFIGAYTGGSGAAWDPGTDYNDPEQRANMLASVEDMVKEFRHEPYILMWILGNENNYEFTHTNAGKFPEVYAKFVDQLAKRIHELDPHHPVVLCNGDTFFISYYARYAPNIDIFGVNSYPDLPFGTLWSDVAKGLNKPVIVTEFGEGKPKFNGNELDEEYQAQRISSAWCDIARHTAGSQSPANALGGFVFEWLDNWWQDWGPTIHNRGQEGWDHEWMGLTSQGDGQMSPFLRQLRKSYFLLQSYWTDKNSCQEKP
jgi:beta-glucuronidase